MQCPHLFESLHDLVMPVAQMTTAALRHRYFLGLWYEGDTELEGVFGGW
jgi:hypothetical protein